MSWEVAVMFVISLVALGGLNLAAIRLLFSQHKATERERLNAVERPGGDFSHEIERAVSALKAELPSSYVRREDWIRFGAVTDAKIDMLRQHMEAVREKLYGHPQS